MSVFVFFSAKILHKRHPQYRGGDPLIKFNYFIDPKNHLSMH